LATDEGLLVSAAIRDITERKKLEEKFRSLLDSAPDATVIVNEKGLIQMINHQTENLFGYRREELIGQPVEKLIPADLKDKHIHHRASFHKMPRVRQMGEGIELQAVKKDGTSFPVEISLSPIQTEEGVLVSASVRDITVRRRLENELKKSNEELEAFTYSVSHDLRAPLRGIIGFTAILEEDYSNKLDAEAVRITSVIKQNTLKMGHLIDDLLSFSRMGRQEISKTEINMNHMVAEIRKELAAEKNDPVIVWKINPLPKVQGDNNTLRQVWINLLSNAIKYSANNKLPKIEVGGFAQDGQVVFYVRDNGVGFDEEYKDKLFKVFQRLHSSDEFEGTGVGLAIVEKIISRHGGKVWAEGKIGKGASFYFSLPQTNN
jgi:PAS domain S-box-containing protein